MYAKGYTLAEAGYPSIQPTTFFRQASVSKTIVALGRVPPDTGRAAHIATPVQDVLHLQRPDGTAPTAGFSQVTVQHLLEHTSGLPNGCYGVEPLVVSGFNAVPGGPPAFLAGRLARPTDRYMITLPATPPPATPMYNNWGYFLLGHVVMAVTGSATLVQALDGLLFQPLGIARSVGPVTRIEDQPPDEARYHATRCRSGPAWSSPIAG